ncbi:MAG: glycoside hydrolase family 2, partial [Clostridia bacterium]
MEYPPKHEYPRPDCARDHWLNLNGAWDFALFPAGCEADEEVFAQKRGAYDRQIMVPFSWTCPLSGVEEDVAGIGWYRRKATFHAYEHVFLCFGAVDYACEAFINGVHVGYHEGGYTSFEFDVTACWHDGENLIEVRAADYRMETQTYGKQG